MRPAGALRPTCISTSRGLAGDRARGRSGGRRGDRLGRVRDRPTTSGTVYFGEVGLSGEVRQVAQAEARLKEAAKLGFDTVCLPRRLARGGRAPAAPTGLRLDEIGHLADLVAKFGEGARPPG